MSQLRVSHVRHVGVGVPDYEQQVEFYGGVWGLTKQTSDTGITFFAAEGSPEQYIYRVRKSADNRVDLISFGVENAATVDAFAEKLAAENVRFASEPGPLRTPGGGYGFRFFDPDGRTLEISSDVEERPFRVLEPREAIPEKLSHVVMNSDHLEDSVKFYQETLGMRLSGWISDFFCFLRTEMAPDFHSIALVRSKHTNLHHVAFHAHGLEEYMRSVGKALRANVPMIHGIGKHLSDPVDSAFAYFVDPNGQISEHHAPQTFIVDDDAYDPPCWGPGEPEVWGTARSQNMPEDEIEIARHSSDPGLWVAPPI